MQFDLPKQVTGLTKKFNRAGYDIYVVGGAVRDLLMGKIVHDWDFTTNATPEQMLAILPNDAYYTNDFGTVGLPIDGFDTPFEITTFRTEHGYSDSRRPDKVEWGKTLDEDLVRRDFTINAMAIDCSSSKPKLLDKFDGEKDIKSKLIRAVGNPATRFREDALRMMRAIRIGAELGFTIEEQTFDAIRQGAELLTKVSAERVRDELFKTLGSQFPYEGAVMLHTSGLMQVVLPEFEEGFGVEQKSPGRHHIYDVGTHGLLALKECPSTDPLVRLAALLHDIGKPRVVKTLETGVITFYNHEVVGARMVKAIAERLRLSNAQKDKLWKLVRFHQFVVDENQTDKAIRRFIRNVGVENVSDMMDLRTGDRLGGGATETSWRTEEFKKRLIEVQKQPFTVRDLKISGADVMSELKLKPGPQVGKILTDLFDKVVDKKVTNTKAALTKELRKIKKV